jgi:hypothetical protein
MKMFLDPFDLQCSCAIRFLSFILFFFYKIRFSDISIFLCISLDFTCILFTYNIQYRDS